MAKKVKKSRKNGVFEGKKAEKSSGISGEQKAERGEKKGEKEAQKETWRGFLSAIKAIMSKACCTMRMACSFLPELRPCIMRELTRRSTRGHCAFRKRFFWYLRAPKGKF
ncbi:hypothetical protein ETH_00001130 [Eimeria tenella]|uniref:Uncharacterized protein n=1 Tax=Eimeria tenella TaxID=5802 RepID=U6KR59_EIMTE|nr:hypothetical protein ETH_00001130 [Eimeria tenella]CDJ37913.1 hypothetical protein ETH_00001130 [Eimeria tenella]|eukprot:XP_013228751.1 hypothetical protein ETH_00001130 [Eimeria tenella]